MIRSRRPQTQHARIAKLSTMFPQENIKWRQLVTAKERKKMDLCTSANGSQSLPRCSPDLLGDAFCSLSLADGVGTSANRDSMFLNLPGEIRNKIYRYLLVLDNVVPLILKYDAMLPEYCAGNFRFVKTCSKLGGSDMTYTARIPSGTLYMWNFVPPGLDRVDSVLDHAIEKENVLALLSVCRQIHKEAKGIFWTENAFICHDTFKQQIYISSLKQRQRRFGTTYECFSESRDKPRVYHYGRWSAEQLLSNSLHYTSDGLSSVPLGELKDSMACVILQYLADQPLTIHRLQWRWTHYSLYSPSAR